MGCPHLRKELKRIQPGLHVFGHVHASRGTQIEGATRFVNAAIVGGRNYEVRHTPIGISLFSDDEHQDPMESLQNLDRKTGIRSDALAALQRWSLNLKRTFLGLREAWSLVGGGIAVAILLCVLHPEFRGWILGILAAFLIIVIFVTSVLSEISVAFSYPCGRCGCLGWHRGWPCHFIVLGNAFLLGSGFTLLTNIVHVQGDLIPSIGTTLRIFFHSLGQR